MLDAPTRTRPTTMLQRRWKTVHAPLKKRAQVTSTTTTACPFLTCSPSLCSTAIHACDGARRATLLVPTRFTHVTPVSRAPAPSSYLVWFTDLNSPMKPKSLTTKCLTSLMAFMLVAGAVLAQPSPPSGIYLEDLRVWLNSNWYDGYHDQLGYNEGRRQMYGYTDILSNGNVECIGLIKSSSDTPDKHKCTCRASVRKGR